jgi:hypothetical protein
MLTQSSDHSRKSGYPNSFFFSDAMQYKRANGASAGKLIYFVYNCHNYIYFFVHSFVVFLKQTDKKIAERRIGYYWYKVNQILTFANSFTLLVLCAFRSLPD